MPQILYFAAFITKLTENQHNHWYSQAKITCKICINNTLVCEFLNMRLILKTLEYEFNFKKALILLRMTTPSLYINIIEREGVTQT